MKIQPNPLSSALNTLDAEARTRNTRQNQAVEPSTRVSISSEAQFVSRVKHDARDLRVVRPEVVDDVRQRVLNGTFDATVDMESVVDSLLADL
jgi:flagellar biosynthesis anti-sigma factor FlgM